MQAMLSKVTSKEQAKELAQRAETAGAMIGDGVIYGGQISLPAFSLLDRLKYLIH